MTDTAMRGSDDEYCSAGVAGHNYVAHSVDAPPIRFVDRCPLCGHISSRSLRHQLTRPRRDDAAYNEWRASRACD